MMFYVAGWIVMYMVFTFFYQEIVIDTSYKTMLRYPGIYYTESFVVFVSTLFYTMKVKKCQVGMKSFKIIAELKSQEANENMCMVLGKMVPQHVILPMLRNPFDNIAESIDHATVLFLMISNFHELSHDRTPARLLQTLNQTFIKLDNICTYFNVTKIETVMEEYVCAVGVSPEDVQEAFEFGHSTTLLRLFQAAETMLSCSDGTVVYKAGLHSGPVVAGVIGRKLPRFRLFGDTINTAARMMQKGVDGKLQFGNETHAILPPRVKVTPRGMIEMKGKGMVQTYFFNTVESTCAAQAADRKKELAKLQLDAAVVPVVNVGLCAIIAQAPHHPADTDDMDDLVMDARVSQQHRRKAKRRQTVQKVADHHEDNAHSPKNPKRRHRKEAREPKAKVNERTNLVSLEKQKTFNPPMIDPFSTATIAAMRFKRHLKSRRAHSPPPEADDDDTKIIFDDSWLSTCVQEKQIATDAVAKRALEMLKEDIKRQDIGDHAWKDEWARWYHRNEVCRQLPARLEILIVAVMVTALFELMYLMSVKGMDRMDRISTQLHVTYATLFIFRVIIPVSILGLWRLAVHHPDLNEYILDNPYVTEALMTVTGMIFAVCFYLAYMFYSCAEKKFCLFFILAYFLITRMRLLVQFSFIYLAFGIFIMVALNVPSLNPIHSLYLSFLGQALFVGCSVSNLYISYEDNQSSRSWWRMKQSVASMQERIDSILSTLMPPLVVEELRLMKTGSQNLSHPYIYCTVAQSDLCGFTKLAATRTPYEVVDFISDLFGQFDELTDMREVYKVETVGDAYIAARAEYPLSQDKDALEVILFGLDMIRVVNDWALENEVDVCCRVGVHHGHCTGGIVGNDMQRYHLFGSIMHIVDLLESTSMEKHMQISGACYQALLEESEAVDFLTYELRDHRNPLKTSKGELHSFDEVGGNTYIVKEIVEDVEFMEK
jgi:class 3 adenylate cyclase